MRHGNDLAKGFVMGAIGGAVGAFVMEYYWKAAEALQGDDLRQKKEDQGEEGALDSISLVGTNHQEGEASTAAMGRHLYRLVTGREPGSQQTRDRLSNGVHYAISMGAGALYGALRDEEPLPDIAGGAAFGTALWLLGDEVAVPLAGLADGPTAYTAPLHFHAWAAHAVYGIVTAATTQLLRRIL